MKFSCRKDSNAAGPDVTVHTALVETSFGKVLRENDIMGDVLRRTDSHTVESDAENTTARNMFRQ